MRFTNKFLKFCSLTVIKASLIFGVMLSDKIAASTDSLDLANGTFSSKLEKTIDAKFAMNTLGVWENDKGNYLRYKGRIYESGAQCIGNTCSMADVTSTAFDPTAEEYRMENKTTMLNIILGDELANDFIALSRWNSVTNLSKRQLITADTGHMSDKCLKILLNQDKEMIDVFIKDFIKEYKLTAEANDIESLIAVLIKEYSTRLEKYNVFAKNLHFALSNDKEWYSDKPNSATHTEIMMICRILEQVGIRYDSNIYNDAGKLKTAIENNKDIIKTFLPKTIFSSKKMCRTCDTTLAGLYELLYGKEELATTLFVGHQANYEHIGTPIDSLRMADTEIYNKAILGEIAPKGLSGIDSEGYINYLSALAKRLIQIDNLLEDSDINKTLKNTIRRNKETIISKYDEIAAKVGMRKPTDHTGETLLESLKSFLGSTHGTGPGQPPPPTPNGGGVWARRDSKGPVSPPKQSETDNYDTLFPKLA